MQPFGKICSYCVSCFFDKIETKSSHIFISYLHFLICDQLLFLFTLSVQTCKISKSLHLLWRGETENWMFRKKAAGVHCTVGAGQDDQVGGFLSRGNIVHLVQKQSTHGVGERFYISFQGSQAFLGCRHMCSATELPYHLFYTACIHRQTLREHISSLIFHIKQISCEA